MEGECPAKDLSQVLRTTSPEGAEVGTEINLQTPLSSAPAPEEDAPGSVEGPATDSRERFKTLVTPGLIRRHREVCIFRCSSIGELMISG
ncbi:hypothetical protein NDU88_000346 [Pleurodeles waltl]|uniref:Uncharacterized protein n=1 Tax=Pleurodeles waltl TaxID=8319 RepID=A0AAV7Q109_PLEWA|nr:hypothetical protein NDU88_000346 [Pleurodeles waltl]